MKSMQLPKRNLKLLWFVVVPTRGTAKKHQQQTQTSGQQYSSGEYAVAIYQLAA